MFNLRLFSTSFFTFLFMSLTGTVTASFDPLTSEEIDTYFAALESAKANRATLKSIENCTEAEEARAVSVRKKLQISVGDLQRKNNALEIEMSRAEARVEEFEKLFRKAEEEGDAANRRLVTAQAEINSAKERYEQCKNETSFLSIFSIGDCILVEIYNEINAELYNHKNEIIAAERQYDSAQRGFSQAEKDFLGANTKHKHFSVELDQIKNKLQDNADRLSSVKSNLASLREKSLAFKTKFNEYSRAVSEAQDLDLSSIPGRVARRMRQEYAQLLDLQERSVELLAGKGIQLSTGDLICKTNKGR